MYRFSPRTSSSKSLFVWKALAVALGLVVVVGGTLAYASFGLAGLHAQTHAAASDERPWPAHTGAMVTGRLVHAPLSSTVPALTVAQQQALKANQARERTRKPAPVGPVARATAQTEPHPGPQLQVPAQQARTGAAGAQINDTDFVIEQSSTSVGNGTGGPCYASGLCSFIMEPSIGNDGKHIMMSGNWFDAVSHNGGSTWTYLNPLSLITSTTEAFCCDQQILYEASRDRMFWESLWMGNTASDPNSIVLANSAGTDLATWCSYNLTPDKFGLPTTDLLDYPDFATTNDNLFLTFNVYDNTGNFANTIVARLPITPQATNCASLTPQYITITSNFSVALTSGAQGTMWFGSNWYTQTTGTGSQIRIWAWQDPSSSPTFVDRSIDPWNFIGAGSANCGSTDGVVVNWCTRLDSRRGTAYLTKANYRGFGPSSLGFAWSAGANPSAGLPFPYTVREYFNLAGFTYQGHDNMYNQNYAVVYASLAPNFRGFIGGTFSYGGGNSTTHYYPGSAIFIDDPVNPTAPWAVNNWLPGQANTDNNPNDQEYQSWGDFNTARAFSPNGFDWIAGGWRVGSNGVPQAAEVIFGRGRDHNAYLRWSQV